MSVKLADLRVLLPTEVRVEDLNQQRPATVADLVSALRAEGVLVVEKVDSEWPDWAYEKISNRLTSIGGTTYWQKPSHRFAYAKVCMDALADVPLSHVTLPGDALAEAQPFPPAGE